MEKQSSLFLASLFLGGVAELSAYREEAHYADCSCRTAYRDPMA